MVVSQRLGRWIVHKPGQTHPIREDESADSVVVQEMGIPLHNILDDCAVAGKLVCLIEYELESKHCDTEALERGTVELSGWRVALTRVYEMALCFSTTGAAI